MTDTITKPRTWTMWAGTMKPHGTDEVVFCNVGSSPMFVRAYGHPNPVQVQVTEDPEGRYWGWLANTNWDLSLEPVYRENPTMIYPNRNLFIMCFPYGPENGEEHNKGKVLHLSILTLDGNGPETVHEQGADS